MKYLITEQQLGNVLSRLTKTPEDSSWFAKVKNFFGDNDESAGRVILQSIKDGKAVINSFDETRLVILIQTIHFTINQIPIKITRHEKIFKSFKRGGNWDYYLEIPILGGDEIGVSQLMLQNIFKRLMKQNNLS